MLLYVGSEGEKLLESRRELKSLFSLLLHIQCELGGFTVHKPVTAVVVKRHFVSVRYS